MTTEARRAVPCPVPTFRGGGFEPCGDPIELVVYFTDRDESLRRCRKHGEQFTRPPFSDMPTVKVQRL